MLAWVGFEPTATEFRSDALTDWAIRQWVYIYMYPLHSCDYLYKTSIKINVVTYEGISQNDIWH